MPHPLPDEPGAPIARDAIDPELIRLSRSRPKVGLITAAGIIFLCGYFLVRLTPDRRFAGQGPTPERTPVADVVSGRVAVDRFIVLEGAEPLMSAAIRTSTSRGSLGLRVVPVRGTGERLWIAMPGDGWSRPMLGAYAGRLRRLSELPFAPSVTAYAAQHPRPTFATAAAVRAGFATGTVRGVAGDSIAVAAGDRVAFDVLDSTAAVIVGAIGDRLPTAAAWTTALANAGLAATGEPKTTDNAVRVTVKLDGALAGVEAKLEAAKLWAARVEPLTLHYETTWGDLKTSPPTGFGVDGAVIANDQLDLIGLYGAHAIPADAYVVIADDRPDDYWYIQPIAICLALIGGLFVFGLIRTIKRDVLPTRA